MSSKGVSLSLAMKLIALIALDLVLLRALPFLPQSPPLLFALAMLNLVIVQSVILARPLGAFHLTFFVVGLVSSILLTVFAFLGAPPGGSVGSLRILERVVRIYQDLRGEPPWLQGSLESQHLAVAERCLTSTLGLLPAWAAGLWVSRQVRRRQAQSGNAGRHIASFFQGAVIGLAAFTLVVSMIDALGRGSPTPLRWLGLALCLLGGGAAVCLLKGHRQTAGPVNQP